MAVYSIGQLAGNAARRAERAQRTRAHVRRGSREKGTFEADWYRRPQRDQFGLMCDGVRVVDEHEKKQRPGAPAGPLGLVCDKIVRCMMTAIDRATGRLDVSYDWLCAHTGFSRPTIARGLFALAAHGFLEIQRRCVRTDVAENEPGPRWRQATNAYRLKLPALARQLLGFKGEPSPVPSDERDRRAAQSAAAKAMLDELAPDEIGDAVTTDKELARILNRMGRHFVGKRVECELTGLPQPLPLEFDSCAEGIRNRPEGPISSL